MFVLLFLFLVVSCFCFLLLLLMMVVVLVWCGKCRGGSAQALTAGGIKILPKETVESLMFVFDLLLQNVVRPCLVSCSFGSTKSRLI